MSAKRGAKATAGGESLHAPSKLQLLGGFGLLVDGKPVEVSPASQRVLAFLAIARRPVARNSLSAWLWLDKSDERARANLRSALWRLPTVAAPALVDGCGDQIWLSHSVTVDINELEVRARALECSLGRNRPRERYAVPSCHVDVAWDLLRHELLPGWYDDYILVERERIRQTQLHALETLSHALAQIGNYRDAIEVGLVAVAADPLRESSHRAVIAAHLAEGNVSEARRQFAACEAILLDAFGVRPSARMAELMRAPLVVA